MGQSASTAEMPEAQEGQHTISLAATEIIRVAGMSGYHTSVIVDDQETGGPQMSCVSPETDIPPGDGLLKGSEPKAEGTYDVFYKNCNTFTDAALYFLTKTRMPAYCNRIERLVTATDPVSVSLLNRIFKAMVEHQQGVEVDKYVQKVLAETPADVEEVIIEKDGSYRIVEEEQEEGASIKDGLVKRMATRGRRPSFSGEKAKKDAEKPGEEGDEKTSGDGQDGLKRKGTDDGIEVPLSKRQRRRQKILEARGGLPHHEEAPAAETVTTEPDAPATV
eukprot:g6973.t1